MARAGGDGGVKLSAVLLAGGAGRRFGGSKLTANYRGRPLITYALDAALQAPVDRVVLVTGFHAEAVRFVADHHARAEISTGRLTLAHAHDADEGMAASLRTGLKALAPGYDGVFVFLGDMPNIPRGLTGVMATALENPEARAVVPVHEGRRGHPVLFHRTLAPDLLVLTGDEGARSVLASLDPRPTEIDGHGPGVLEDVDVRQVSSKDHLAPPS